MGAQRINGYPMNATGINHILGIAIDNRGMDYYPLTKWEGVIRLGSSSASFYRNGV